MNTKAKKRFFLANLFNFFSIRSKLQSILLLTSFLSILITGTIGYISAQQSLNKSVYDGLTALRVRQAGEVEDYFERTQTEVLSLSEFPVVVQAFKSLKAGYDQLNSPESPAPQGDKKLEEFYQKDVLPKLSVNGGESSPAASYLPQDKAGKYLQWNYIVNNPYPFGDKEKLDQAKDGSAYSQAHAKFHSRFRRLTELFGYYDIYFVDGESGNVFYNVAKEIDLGTNIKDGPFAGSNLAEAFRQVVESRDPNFSTMVDFKNYQPSGGIPASFIATTVFDGPKFLGMLAFQLSTERLNELMTVNQKWPEVGLGKTGESLIVGSDLTARSTPRSFLENPVQYFKDLLGLGVSQQEIDSIKKVNSPIALQEIKSPAVVEALKGKKGTEILKDYRNVDALSSYQPLNIGKNLNPPLKWALVTQMDKSEAFEPIYKLARRLLLASAILLPLVAFISNWIANFFTRPINRLLEGTRRIAQGETDVQVNVTSQDEFGELATSFNEMASNLHEKELTIKEQLAENDRLLLNVLPPSAVERVKDGERDFADSYVNISLLYAEIEGFSELIARVEPSQSVLLLNELVGAFDESAETFGVEKLKTVGTSYLAACGLTVPRVDYAKRIVDFAVEMIKITQRFNKVHNANLSLDIGVHAGPVTGGIVGKSKFIYELWGDSLKIAYAIHSSPDDDVIQVTEPIRNALENIYLFDNAEDKLVKGMGNIAIWQVNYRGSENVIDVVAR